MPKHFFTHAASLDQGFPHCPIFPTAASRRSLGRVSVPMWPVTLSGRLLIVGLVSHYLTNYLIRRGSISYHRSFSHCAMQHCALMRYQQSFLTVIPLYEAGYPRVTHPSAAKSILIPSENFLKIASLDLHVLSTPPAFILSQDRTLKLNGVQSTVKINYQLIYFPFYLLFGSYTISCIRSEFLIQSCSNTAYYQNFQGFTYCSIFCFQSAFCCYLSISNSFILSCCRFFVNNFFYFFNRFKSIAFAVCSASEL